MKVMVSSPVPPTSVSTFVTEPVLAKSPSVSLSEPELRSMLSVAGAQRPSVMVSAPEPPTIALDVGDRDHVGGRAQVTLSVPAPRSTEPLTAGS